MSVGEISLRPAVVGDVTAVVSLVRDVLAEFQITFGVGSKTDDELNGLPSAYENRGGAFWIKGGVYFAQAAPSLPELGHFATFAPSSTPLAPTWVQAKRIADGL